METPFINTVTKAATWVKKCRSPFLQIYPDSGNITNAALENGGEIKEDIKKGAGNLVAFHLKESKPDIYREVTYGQGHVNFSEAIQTVWRLGVRLFVAEFWHSDTVGSWRDTLRENNRFLRKFLDEADCS
jgi:L-ribulose-5-phosphate 3-epimerase UlaE